MFEGVKAATGILGKAAAERAEQLLGHFGATFGSLWVSSGDVGSLNDYFGIIVELLWVYEGPFSKNSDFRHRF